MSVACQLCTNERKESPFADHQVDKNMKKRCEFIHTIGDSLLIIKIKEKPDTHLHLGGSKLWPAHPVALLDHPVKC